MYDFIESYAGCTYMCYTDFIKHFGGIDMGKITITNEMVKCSYETARKVYDKEISRIEGKREISRKTGMGEGSAAIYITAFLSMLNGVRYTQTINFYATKYFLVHIGNDYGVEIQKKAAQATKGHVEYYRTKGGYLAEFDKLAQQYI